jgi:exonuclease V
MTLPQLEKITIKFLQKAQTKPPTIITMKDIQLARDEINTVIQSDFIKRLEPKGGQSLDEIPQKIQKIIRYVPYESGWLKPLRHKFAPSPFEIYTDPYVDNEGSRTSVATLPRLSVTRILTKSWCELRELYNICSQAPRVSTPQMIEGNKIHENLEHASHPPLVIKNPVPSRVPTMAEVETERCIEQLAKLLDLFLTGEARELYYNGFMNVDKGLVTDPKDDDLLLTGIIDHLRIQEDGEVVSMLDDFEIPHNIGHFIQLVKSLPYNSWNLGIYDVKTRRTPSIPRQQSVVEASKDQVRLYEAMLTMMGQSSTAAMSLMEEYMRRKNVDIDESLSSEFVIAAMAVLPQIHLDLMKLKYGEPIGISSFDNHRYETGFEMPELPDPEGTFSLYTGPWKKPLTLRYFLARLSQIYPLISRIPERSMGIEYYVGMRQFTMVEISNIRGRDKQLVRNALQFWYGLREAEPIKQTVENYESKCHYCDFKDYCAWSRDMKEEYVDRRVEALKNA